MMIKYYLLNLLTIYCTLTISYRIINFTTNSTPDDVFRPFDPSFVGIYGDPSNALREQINNGAGIQTSSEELLYTGDSPLQSCPAMIGPFVNGTFYCTSQLNGYCDRRSGTCFCNTGYQGIDCAECTSAYYMLHGVCTPKQLCDQDCHHAGICNYENGTCTCYPHRTGFSCDIPVCSIYSPFCESCTDTECTHCSAGYYLTLNTSSICQSCHDFDPRCSTCSLQDGCLDCIDPLLLSARRSGYRQYDTLPFEEHSRELSINLPFGTQDSSYFTESETYELCGNPENPLSQQTQQCDQGLIYNNATWNCTSILSSHQVCGHTGFFRIQYNNYTVTEADQFLRIVIERSGGGCGNVSIGYYIRHITTRETDIIATAPYTSSQVLVFEPGVIRKSFLLEIKENLHMNTDRICQLILQSPTGGGWLSSQYRANITIINNDIYNTNPLSIIWINHTQNMLNKYDSTVKAIAGDIFSVTFQTYNFLNQNQVIGGDHFISTIISHKVMTGLSRQIQQADVIDYGNGTYTISSILIKQGYYNMNIYYLFPNVLLGEYYSDTQFKQLKYSQSDKYINYHWNDGALSQLTNTNYASIRWSGVLMNNYTGIYSFKIITPDHVRMWINNQLIIEHMYTNAQNSKNEYIRNLYLEAYVYHEIIIEYRKLHHKNAYIELQWSYNQLPYTIIDSTYFSRKYPIAVSPVAIHIISAQSAANTSEINGFSTLYPITLTPHSFSVCPHDIYDNIRNDDDEYYLSTEKFGVTATLIDDNGYHGEGSESIPYTQIYNNNTHCFDFTGIPQRAGIYQYDVYYQSPTAISTFIHESIHGTPFYLSISSSDTYGPSSSVMELPQPLQLTAGECQSFILIAKDRSYNLKLKGGDEFQVYIDQIGAYLPIPGNLTAAPNPSVTTIPTLIHDTSIQYSPYINDQTIVYGMVTDLYSGNYSVTICPPAAGIFELHILLNSKGVSNQPFTLSSYDTTYENNHVGETTYTGQYVDMSPYTVIVSSAEGTGTYSTAEGNGLTSATVGVTSSFIVTVRDAYGNLVTNSTNPPNISVTLPTAPNSIVQVQNFHNGSYYITYNPTVAGINQLDVTINNVSISGSPFQVVVGDGVTSANYSYIIGSPSRVTTAGSEYYFEVEAHDLTGNQKSNMDDLFTFQTVGSNNITGQLFPCTQYSQLTLLDVSYIDPTICSSTQALTNHYFGYFLPQYTIPTTISVYLNNDNNTGIENEIIGSPVLLEVVPSYAIAKNTYVSGSVWETIAGLTSYIELTVHDTYKNIAWNSNNHIQALITDIISNVTYDVYTPHSSSATVTHNPSWYDKTDIFLSYYNQGYHKFLNINPIYYGLVTPTDDGTYLVTYSIPITNTYNLMLLLSEPGLNATYYNDIHSAFNIDILMKRDQVYYEPVNQHIYQTKIDSQIHYNFTTELNAYIANSNTTHQYINSVIRPSYEYFSIRWYGLLTPKYIEKYTFFVNMDDDSSIKVYIQDNNIPIIECNQQTECHGSYIFTSLQPVIIIVTYAHNIGFSFLSLSWKSVTNPYEFIPVTAYSHSMNIANYNLTIVPSILSSYHSTYITPKSMTTGITSYITIYSRDKFNNLLLNGGDTPYVLAIGPQSISYTADNIIDHQNGVYTAALTIYTSGNYSIYISIGCCPPVSDIGLSAQLDKNQPILLNNTPYFMSVMSNILSPSHCLVDGNGWTGGYVGHVLSIIIHLKDAWNNPTTTSLISTLTANHIQVVFYDSNNDIVIPPFINIAIDKDTIEIMYTLTVAETYTCHIAISIESTPINYIPIGSSPLSLLLIVEQPSALVSLGTMQENNDTFSVNQVYNWVIEVYDIYKNPFPTSDVRLYIRAIGDSEYSTPMYIYDAFDDIYYDTLSNPSILSSTYSTLIPMCTYPNNTITEVHHPNYHIINCTSKSMDIGKHQIITKLLNTTYPHFQGGNGLSAQYYTSIKPQSSSPYITTIDSTITHMAIQMSNSNNVQNSPDICMINSDVKKTIYYMCVSHSVIWSGYIVSPQSGPYRFRMKLNENIENTVILLDNSIIYSSTTTNSNNIQKIVMMEANIAYRIEIQVSSQQPLISLTYALQWLYGYPKTFTWIDISTYYLYNNATDISTSPMIIYVV